MFIYLRRKGRRIKINTILKNMNLFFTYKAHKGLKGFVSLYKWGEESF